jgi:outer membrane protein assembly factor BamE (lipoprotein component of BamABCDE complex)
VRQLSRNPLAGTKGAIMILNRSFLFLFFAVVGFIGNIYCQAIKYPYVATTERKTQIEYGFNKIEKGLTYKQVKNLLGQPDEIKPLYQPKIKNPKQIGTTYWYIIQRTKENGSVKEKNEKLVRVSFSLSGKVTQIDHWGF